MLSDIPERSARCIGFSTGIPNPEYGPEHQRTYRHRYMMLLEVTDWVYDRDNYYNNTRTHLSLGKDSPVSRTIEAIGRIISIPVLGGLHHRYARI